MLLEIPKDFCWPDRWEPLGVGHTFETELQREVCPSHPLYQVECRAVARRKDDGDEILFTTARPDMPIAWVHLTWSVETDPDLPFAVGYESWEAFRVAWRSRGTASEELARIIGRIRGVGSARPELWK